METTKQQPLPFNWVNILFLVISPILAAGGTIWYVMNYGVHPVDFTLLFVMYVFTGMGVTGGYHRLYAHNSYVCRKSLEFFYLVFGAAALQNSALRWCRDHRIHHSKVDTDEDPYNIMRGALYAHIGWIFYKNPGRDEDFSIVPDMQKNKLVLWQDRHYLPIALFSGFVLPTFIGWCFDRPLGGFLWGGLVRVVLVHHLTFCINSLAHMFGSQPYSIKNSGRDSWWLGPITYGEGYHNFHHRFPGDYRNGVHWYQFDMTKWWINTMDWLGLVGRKTWFREEHLLRAKIETEFLRVKLKLASAPEPLAVRIERRLEAARMQLEEAGVRWQTEKRRFRAAKAEAMEEYGKSYEIWKLKVRQYNLQYQLAQARWAMLIAAVSRLHHASPIN